MNILLLIAVYAQPAQPVIQFDTLTLEAATRLNGQRVTIDLTVGAPAYTWVVNDVLRTIVGPEDRDGLERVVSLVGDRLDDADEGTELRVRGILEVIEHPASVCNAVRIEAWVEIKLTEDAKE